MGIQEGNCINRNRLKRSVKRIPLCQEVDHLGKCVDGYRKLKGLDSIAKKDPVLRPYLKKV